MIYQMNLAKEPFDLIQSGQKTIEMRLNKPGREKITKGDTIVFNSNDGRKLSVLVLNISKFPSFSDLYRAFGHTKLGYQKGQVADPDDMLIYYKKEDIEKYGVLAIEIKLQ